MRTARLVIIDDEPLARERVRTLLPHEGVAVVGEAASVAEAVQVIAREAPDILLLDIEMPDGTGFDVLAGVAEDHAPLVVFVTAYDQYAVRAFEAAAVDYVLKPVEPDRLQAALTRALLQLDPGHARRRWDSTRSLVRALIEARRAERIVLHAEGRTYVVAAAQIVWVEAKRNTCLVHLNDRTVAVRETMTNLLSRLPRTLFARAHRSAIVNLSHVRYAEPFFRGEHVLVLSDGTRVTTSRLFGRQVHRFLQ
jgi:two-component system LytT family response regulator